MKVLREEVKMYPTYDYKKDFVNRNGKGLNNRIKEAILKYLDNYNFDLEDTCIDAYLIDPKSKKKKVKDNVRDKKEVRDNMIADKDKLLQEIKSRQRIFKVTPDYEAMKSLIKNNLDSAYKISYIRDMKQFRDVLGGVEKAKTIRVNAIAQTIQRCPRRCRRYKRDQDPCHDRR